MDRQPEQVNPEPDSLDRLLAEARWAEPRPEAIARLRGQWRSLMANRQEVAPQTSSRGLTRRQRMGCRHRRRGRRRTLARCGDKLHAAGFRTAADGGEHSPGKVAEGGDDCRALAGPGAGQTGGRVQTDRYCLLAGNQTTVRRLRHRPQSQDDCPPRGGQARPPGWRLWKGWGDSPDARTATWASSKSTARRHAAFKLNTENCLRKTPRVGQP